MGELFDFLQQCQQKEEPKVIRTIELGSTFDDQDWRIYDQIVEKMENVYVNSETIELVAMFPEDKLASPELVTQPGCSFLSEVKIVTIEELSYNKGVEVDNEPYTSHELKMMKLSVEMSMNTMKPSSIEPPQLELKPLPENLKYAFLGPSNTLPVIISSCLTAYH